MGGNIQLMNKKEKLSLLLFLTLLLYVLSLVWVYKGGHFNNSLPENNLDTINNTVPNINNACFYDYYNIKKYLEENEVVELSSIRYRKEITLNKSCYGKVSGINIVPGTKLENLEPQTYISLTINQPRIFNLWLFEIEYLIFFSLFMMIIFVHIILFRKEIFNLILLLILIYSLTSFSSENMFLNSPKKYFPNPDVTNSNIFLEKGLK